MIHEARGEWKLEGFPEASINVLPLYKLAEHRNMQPIYVDISLIGHRPIDSIKDSDPRYIDANPEEPVLLIQNMDNPHAKMYRMVDGRHRLLKRLESKHHIIPAYVFTPDEFHRFCEVR